jgi:hypothetical protein
MQRVLAAVIRQHITGKNYRSLRGGPGSRYCWLDREYDGPGRGDFGLPRLILSSETGWISKTVAILLGM